MGLKEKLLDYIAVEKTLSRTELTNLVRKWGYEKSNAERRMRDLCEEQPIRRYDANGKEVMFSRWICYWKLTGKIKKSTVLK